MLPSGPSASAAIACACAADAGPPSPVGRSEEHTSELQSQSNLVCRLLLEKKKKYKLHTRHPIYSPNRTATTIQLVTHLHTNRRHCFTVLITSSQRKISSTTAMSSSPTQTA